MDQQHKTSLNDVEQEQKRGNVKDKIRQRIQSEENIDEVLTSLEEYCKIILNSLN